MRHTDVAIVGGGLAGSMAAAMLGRAGISALLVDPNESYPADFRCEKIDASQLVLLQRTGLAEVVLPEATLDTEVWVARLGRLVRKKRYRQYNLRYDTFVNAVRSAVGGAASVLTAKVTGIELSADRQLLRLSNGEEISARLVVIANGLNSAIRQNFGIGRRDISANHSVSIGFDVRPVGAKPFDFRALTYFGERPGDRMAYLALFPIGAAMRVNFFVYRDVNDEWLRKIRRAPVAAMFETMKGLRRLTGDMEAVGPVAIRPVDLYVSEGYERSGIVLVGDAFGTSCPAAGTGTSKVMVDVERLCHHHVPIWLATPGMAMEKIGQFYADPVKQASDRQSLTNAMLLRALSTETGLAWKARRGARFVRQLLLGVTDGGVSTARTIFHPAARPLRRAGG